MDLLITLLLINTLRAAPLATDAVLTERAEARAAYLCERTQWSHDGFEDSFTGLPYRYAGENLARGFTAPAPMVVAWLTSDTHRANMLAHHYKKTGMAQGKCGTVVQLFTD